MDRLTTLYARVYLSCLVHYHSGYSNKFIPFKLELECKSCISVLQLVSLLTGTFKVIHKTSSSRGEHFDNVSELNRSMCGSQTETQPIETQATSDEIQKPASPVPPAEAIGEPTTLQEVEEVTSIVLAEDKSEPTTQDTKPEVEEGE